MPQIMLNVSPSLEQEVHLLAQETNETTEQLAIRLLQEYVEDCHEADRISAEVEAGRMKTYSWEEVKSALALES